MRKRYQLMAAAGALASAGVLAVILPGQFLTAADHLDPPTLTDPLSDTTPDRAADLADVYAWHTATSVVLVITFAGPQATTLAANYDRDVLYTLNISNAPPRTTPDIPILVRFGPGTTPGQFGIKVSGLPGVTGDLIGPVETDLVKDGVKVRAGLFDDPFFFDVQGLRETRATGTLSFMRTRDGFGAQNITGVVIEIPRDRIANGNNLIDIWATTGRFGGQLS